MPTYSQRVVQTSNMQSSSNGIAIVGFIFAFIIPLIGLICSIIGCSNAKKKNAPYGGLAVAGIVISVIAMVPVFFLFATVFAAILTI